jgi:hypothetical protein
MPYSVYVKFVKYTYILKVLIVNMFVAVGLTTHLNQLYVTDGAQCADIHVVVLWSVLEHSVVWQH